MWLSAERLAIASDRLPGVGLSDLILLLSPVRVRRGGGLVVARGRRSCA